ncbi:RNA polymerase sigma factor [Taibaiella chishuiensis]|uniref:RNA polymerase sigma-70 factor (ECF subfamily) n=1 Tax=Taibaiella chishuiensis TaxID=1434707 RepID=A0A2P8D0Q8_9BACT|nr:sigma-70 family RNA polymerase sigma factor [Taibaiella chishuiensis]PSK90800.1 RNA polymerase sigma-70 factor (ECF subfamily) [Taibaiella chishuiensis]
MYQKLPDSDLFKLLKSDDQKALSALYYRYWDKLFIIATHQLSNPEIAEECVHDIFISLWNKRHELELKYTLATYLAVSVKYVVIRQRSNIHRAKYHLDQSANETAESLSPSADHLILEKELFATIEAAIEKLPEKCRIVFRLAKQQGKTHKQISAELGIAEKTIEAHLSKAMKDLRSNLSAIPPAIIILLIGNN